MVAFPVVVFVQAEGAVAVEIFEVAVERQGRAEQRQFIGGARAERRRGGERDYCQSQFHESPQQSRLG